MISLIKSQWATQCKMEFAERIHHRDAPAPRDLLPPGFPVVLKRSGQPLRALSSATRMDYREPIQGRP